MKLRFMILFNFCLIASSLNTVHAAHGPVPDAKLIAEVNARLNSIEASLAAELATINAKLEADKQVIARREADIKTELSRTLATIKQSCTNAKLNINRNRAANGDVVANVQITGAEYQAHICTKQANEHAADRQASASSLLVCANYEAHLATKGAEDRAALARTHAKYRLRLTPHHHAGFAVYNPPAAPAAAAIPAVILALGTNPDVLTT